MRAFIHIGKHKTGTTSFQSFMEKNSSLFEQHGFLYVPTVMSSFIAACIIRDEMPIPPRKKLLDSDKPFDIDVAAKELKGFLANRSFDTLVISCEHFSFFRQQDEIDRLNDLLYGAFGIRPDGVTVIAVFRDKTDFLASYKDQTIKAGHGLSRDKESPYYCGADSWLVDDDAIRALWSRNFPRFSSIDYDKSNVVRILSEKMQLPDSEDVDNFQMNKRLNSVHRFAKRVIPRNIWSFMKKIKIMLFDSSGAGDGERSP